MSYLIWCSISIRTLVKSVNQKINFLISQLKHMLWVLKRTVSMRYVQTDGLENIYNFTLIVFYLNLCLLLVKLVALTHLSLKYFNYRLANKFVSSSWVVDRCCFFLFYFKFYRKHCKQTVETLIRHHILWCLIR